jgi:hypothetical protein
MFYRIMNDVHTRTVVCCYRGRVGTDLSVFWVAYWFSIPRFVTSLAENPVIINKALFICIYLFKDAVSILDRITVNDCGIVNSEVGRMGKEAIVTYVEYCFSFAWNHGENRCPGPDSNRGPSLSRIYSLSQFSCVKFTKAVIRKVSSILYTYFTREGSHYVILCVCVCVCMCVCVCVCVSRNFINRLPWKSWFDDVRFQLYIK